MYKKDNNNDKLKWFVKNVGKGVLCFLITLGVLFSLLFFACCIPKYKIRENLLESARYLLANEAEFHQLKSGDRRTEIHNYADATTMNILYSVDGENLLWEMVMSPFYSDKMNLDKSMTELLTERIRFERPNDTLYDRYWHGMIIFLKPLFVLFTLQQIRGIFLGLLIICMLVLTMLLVRQKQYLSPMLLWLGALSVKFWMAGFCIEYFPVFLITFLLSVCMVLWEEKRERIIRLCIVSGVCVAFFDFLTTETLAFVIPMAIVYGIWRRKGTLKSFKEEILYLFRAGCSWGMAYVFTYVTKWTLASIAYGEERFSVALSQLAGRQGNSVISFAADSIGPNGISADALQNAGGEVLPQFLSAVVINIRLLLGLSGKISLEKLALLLLVLGLIIVAVIYLFRKPGPVEVLSGILFLLGTIPILRMMVLNNHSTEHCFFVYRSLYGTIICFSAGIIHLFDWEFIRRRRKNGGKRIKKQGQVVTGMGTELFTDSGSYGVWSAGGQGIGCRDRNYPGSAVYGAFR